jgi:hypothetical protein
MVVYQSALRLTPVEMPTACDAAPADCAPPACAVALKALSHQETDSKAHVVLGIENHWNEWDWSVAERGFRRGIELDPDAPISCPLNAATGMSKPHCAGLRSRDPSRGE